MADNASMWTAIAMIVTTIVTAVITSIRQERQRTWLQEDRAIERQERLAVAASIRAKVEEQHKEVIGKIEENTTISTEAFTEANGINAKNADLNAKIAALQAQILFLQRRTPPVADPRQSQQLDTIEHESKQHTSQLEKIQKCVDPS